MGFGTRLYTQKEIEVVILFLFQIKSLLNQAVSKDT